MEHLKKINLRQRRIVFRPLVEFGATGRIPTFITDNLKGYSKQVTQHRRQVQIFNLFWCSYFQVSQLQQRHKGMQSVRHGPPYCSWFGGVPCRPGYRIPGEQLCWRAHQTLRIQEVKWSHPEDCGLRIPGCGFGRWMPRTLSQFTLPLSLLWLRWHWRDGLSAEPSLARYPRWHTGDFLPTTSKNTFPTWCSECVSIIGYILHNSFEVVVVLGMCPHWLYAHQTSFGWSNQEDWDGQDMWHVWGRGEVHTGL
jgi:hypothetical protein